jgi:hypothetical protein
VITSKKFINNFQLLRTSIIITGVKMAKNEMYSGRGKTLEEATATMHANAENSMAGQMQTAPRYTVTLLKGKKEIATGTQLQLYEAAFASALQDAGISAEDYMKGRYTLQVVAEAAFISGRNAKADKTAQLNRDAGKKAKPSGAAMHEKKVGSLTDLF